MNRRELLAGAAALPVGAAPASQPDFAVLVEATVSSVVPARAPGFTYVRTEHLRALCDAADVRFRRAHWE